MISSKRVSVVIPAYNASMFIATTLRSVASQTARPGEIIVVDDGSSDDTAAIAESFGATLISLKHRGVSAARNAGVSAARGEYVAFLDADDVWTQDKLAVQLAALASYNEPAFSFTDYRTFGELGNQSERSVLGRRTAFREGSRRMAGSVNMIIRRDDVRPVLRDSYIPPSSVIARRGDILAVGGFDETLSVTEDFEFHLRLLNIVPAIAVMSTLLLYRQHQGQATAKSIACTTGFFDVARRVHASPERYPRGDVLYIERTEFLRHYRLGIAHARLGAFDQAISQFESSLAARPNQRARAALLAARVAQSPSGAKLFEVVRALWRCWSARQRSTQS